MKNSVVTVLFLSSLTFAGQAFAETSQEAFVGGSKCYAYTTSGYKPNQYANPATNWSQTDSTNPFFAAPPITTVMTAYLNADYAYRPSQGGWVWSGGNFGEYQWFGYNGGYFSYTTAQDSAWNWAMAHCEATAINPADCRVVACWNL